MDAGVMGPRFAVLNPATGQQIADVPQMGAAETRAAIATAAVAQRPWAALPARARAQVLRRWFDLVVADTEGLAALITAESGKPLSEARGEVAYGAAFLEWFAEEARRVQGEVIPAPRADQRLLVLRQPVGVVAAITPWNFPLAMITRKVAPALAVGCAAVVKPAAETPLTALRLAELAAQAGLPDGLLSVITGTDAAAIGRALTESPTVRALSFTGSTAVGRRLMADCAPTVKKLALELGGNAPFLVFADADLDAAVAGAIAAKFRNAGQTCVCVNRFLVADAVFDDFAARLTRAVTALPMGPGTDPATRIGPLIRPDAVTRVAAHVSDAIDKGARLLCGGLADPAPGNWFHPTVLADVPATARIAQEETFGPVAALFRFHTEAEAIALANDTEFGLAGYVYTRDLGRALRVTEALEVGMVGVNEGLISTEVAPFGGIKQSGLGREGGRLGVEEYLEPKYVCIRLDAAEEAA